MLSVRLLFADLPFSDCCTLHGHVPSLRSDFRALLIDRPVVLILDHDYEVGIPPDLIAVTAFWHQFLAPDTTPPPAFTFNSARICRLHQRSACRFGRDCNNIHVCRSFWGELGGFLKAGAQPISAPPRSPRNPTEPPAPILPSRTPREGTSSPPLIPSTPVGHSPPPPPVVLLDLATKRGILHHVSSLGHPEAFTAMITQGLSPEEYKSLTQLLRNYYPEKENPLQGL